MPNAAEGQDFLHELHRESLETNCELLIKSWTVEGIGRDGRTSPMTNPWMVSVSAVVESTAPFWTAGLCCSVLATFRLMTQTCSKAFSSGVCGPSPIEAAGRQ